MNDPLPLTADDLEREAWAAEQDARDAEWWQTLEDADFFARLSETTTVVHIPDDLTVVGWHFPSDQVELADPAAKIRILTDNLRDAMARAAAIEMPS